MMPSAAPNRTVVVAVGISDYPDMGPSWALPRARDSAIGFADWACRAGIPPGNVHLFLSRADRITARGPSGINRYDATKTHFDAFRDTLKKQSGDLLYFFWAGHGSVEDQRRQVLYYASAGLQDPQHLNLYHFWDQLRSEPHGAFRLQVGVIDACATEASDLGFEVRLGEERPAMGSLLHGIQQTFVLAAQPGSEAVSGAVSAGALDYLNGWLNAGAPYPPNPDDLIESVCARLPADRKPIALHYKNLDGKEHFEENAAERPPTRAVMNAAANAGYTLDWLVGLARIAATSDALADRNDRSGRDQLYGALAPEDGHIAARPFVRDTERDLLQIIAFAFSEDKVKELVAEMAHYPSGNEFALELERFEMLKTAHEVLSEASLRFAQLLPLYLHVIKGYPYDPERRDVRSVPEMLDELSQLGMSDSHDYYRALSLFILRAAERFDAKRDLLHDFVKSFMDKDLFDERRREVLKDASFVLSIMVAPGAVERMPASVVGKLLFADTSTPARSYPVVETPTWRAVEERAAEIVGDARALVLQFGRDERAMEIEFLVSDGCFSRAPHRYRVKLGMRDPELGALHGVVVRWRERLVAPHEAVNIQDWRDIGRRVKRMPQPVHVWFDSAAKASAGARHVRGAALLKFFPSDDDLLDVVSLGFPWIAWFEEPPADRAGNGAAGPQRSPWSWSTHMRRVSTWLKDVPIDRIPQVAPSVRSRGESFGRRMTLFWDDPERDAHWPSFIEVSEP